MASQITEKMIMKLEVLKGDKLAKTNEMFREMVQLKERLGEVENNIQYARGAMDAFVEFQKLVVDMEQAQKIEDIKAQRQAKLQSIPEKQPEVIVSGDGSHDK